MSFRTDFNSVADPNLRDALGDAVIYTPNSGGGPVTLTGLFDPEFEILIDEEAGIEGTVPAFQFLEADVVAVSRLDLIEFDSVVYEVRSIQISGDGIITYILELQ